VLAAQPRTATSEAAGMAGGVAVRSGPRNVHPCGIRLEGLAQASLTSVCLIASLRPRELPDSTLAVQHTPPARFLEIASRHSRLHGLTSPLDSLALCNAGIISIQQHIIIPASKEPHTGWYSKHLRANGLQSNSCVCACERFSGLETSFSPSVA
jgi:hypothetical protein